MNLLILPGNSSRHKQWLRDAEKVLAPFFDEIRSVEYDHWSKGGEVADITDEINKAQRLVANWGEYVVLAKSIGTVIAALGNAGGKLAAKRYVLLGVPYEGIAGRTLEFEPLLALLPSSIIIQNTSDPVGGFLEVRKRLEALNVPHIHLIETPGDTHDYTDFALYATTLLKDR